MDDLRKKYKATKLVDLKKQEKIVESLVGKKNWDRVPYHDIDSGKNKFRIYPARENESSFIFPKTVCFLPLMVFVDEDGREVYNPSEEDKKNLTKKLKKKPIFNAKAHSKSGSDLVEEYIKFAIDYFKKNFPEKKATEKIKALTNWQKGLGYNTTWVCYADKYTVSEKKLGFLEISNGNKNKMNELSIIEEEGDPISVDPFTDVDDGICLIVMYDPTQKDYKNYYKLSLEEKSTGRFSKNLIPTSLTDGDLKIWEKLEPLSSLFKNTFKREDFLKQLDGLKNFDEANNFEIFTSDDWFEIVEDLDKIFSTEEYESKKKTLEKEDEFKEEEREKEASIDSQENQSKKYEEATIVEEEDEFTLFSILELKTFIEKNPKLGIIVRKFHTAEDLRYLIRNSIKELEEEDSSKKGLESPSKDEKIAEGKIAEEAEKMANPIKVEEEELSKSDTTSKEESIADLKKRLHLS